MFHYIALNWKPEHNAALRAARRFKASLKRGTTAWEALVDRDGLAVYSRRGVHEPMQTHLLRGGGGIIFGRLFRSGSAGGPVDVSKLEALALIKDGGMKLLNDYWGSYVAILHSADDHTLLVTRDCSGRIPCYYLNIGGLFVFFSDINDLEPFGLRFTINTRYLAAYILRFPLHVRETGLVEVSELLAGDCVSISPRGTSHECLWNPCSIAKEHIRDDYAQARSELRALTEQTIRCWASLPGRILLELSGGLDSAIVLGCLKTMNCADRVVCVNQYTEGTDDDERPYARAAAEMAVLPLLEVPRASDARLLVDALQSFPAEPSPDILQAMRILSLDGVSEIAAQYQCNTVWTGQGGDHIFLQLRTGYSAVDYLLQRRNIRHFFPVLYESAVLSTRSIWSVLAEALPYLCRMATAPPRPFDFSGLTLMTPSAVAEISETYSDTPWHASFDRIPPGKQTQITIFSDLLNRHKPPAGREWPHECHPLISQPLLELSLRIPTYLLLKGGRQRAMARAAFADRVPPCILLREDKGSVVNQTRALLRGSCALLRDTLLDGTLVSLGIVNRSSLEKFIVAQTSFRDTEIYALFACIAAEIWAGHWLKHVTQVRPDPSNIETSSGHRRGM